MTSQCQLCGHLHLKSKMWTPHTEIPSLSGGARVFQLCPGTPQDYSVLWGGRNRTASIPDWNTLSLICDMDIYH